MGGSRAGSAVRKPETSSPGRGRSGGAGPGHATTETSAHQKCWRPSAWRLHCPSPGFQNRAEDSAGYHSKSQDAISSAPGPGEAVSTAAVRGVAASANSQELATGFAIPGEHLREATPGPDAESGRSPTHATVTGSSRGKGLRQPAWQRYCSGDAGFARGGSTGARCCPPPAISGRGCDEGSENLEFGRGGCLASHEAPGGHAGTGGQTVEALPPHGSAAGGTATLQQALGPCQDAACAPSSAGL